MRKYINYLKSLQQILKGKIFISLSIGLLASIVISIFTGFANDCNEIRQSVFRLHILANSDTTEDQSLKLKVRDKILDKTSYLFENVKSSKEAKKIANENIDKIIEVAQQEVYNQGYDYKVNAYVANMYFDTRDYDTFSLPAGKYDALRVTIGQANGKNWWCVLYPSMCLPSAKPKDSLQNSNLDKSQTDIIEKPHKYKAQFAIVELFESIKNKLFG